MRSVERCAQGLELNEAELGPRILPTRRDKFEEHVNVRYRASFNRKYSRDEMGRSLPSTTGEEHKEHIIGRALASRHEAKFWQNPQILK